MVSFLQSWFRISLNWVLVLKHFCWFLQSIMQLAIVKLVCFSAGPGKCRWAYPTQFYGAREPDKPGIWRPLAISCDICFGKTQWVMGLSPTSSVSWLKETGNPRHAWFHLKCRTCQVASIRTWVEIRWPTRQRWTCSHLSGSYWLWTLPLGCKRLPGSKMVVQTNLERSSLKMTNGWTRDRNCIQNCIGMTGKHRANCTFWT